MSELPPGSRITVSDFARIRTITIPRPIKASMLPVSLVPFLLGLSWVVMAAFFYFVIWKAFQKSADIYPPWKFDDFIPPNSPYAPPSRRFPNLNRYLLNFMAVAWVVMGLIMIWIFSGAIKRRKGPRAETFQIWSNGVVYDAGIPVLDGEDFPSSFIERGSLSSLTLEEHPDGKRLTVMQGGQRVEIADSATEAERLWLYHQLREEFGLDAPQPTPA